MEIIFSVTDNTLIAELFGELDHHAAEGAREKIDEALDNYRVDNLVFDFAKISFMDSSGIGMILGRYKKVTAQGGRVKIRNAGSLVRQLLDLAGVFSLMEYEEDGEETDGK